MFLTPALYLHLDNFSVPKTQVLQLLFEMLCTQPCVYKDGKNSGAYFWRTLCSKPQVNKLSFLY